jgi:indole-3-glycerol phosphate synthase/phosphoribosylanthranilate isomerase
MPQLKVCGINDAAFAVEAAQRGIDYLGLIFAEGSTRCVTVNQAHEIAAAVSKWRTHQSATVRLVGVFVEHTPSEIADIAVRVGLDVIQLHGNFGADEVACLKSKGYEVWCLYRPDAETAGNLPAAKCEDAVLLDGRCGTESRRADWTLVAPLKHGGHRVVLAGRISAANIVDAIATGADVIDVNSSIEVAPGVKSVALLGELLSQLSTMCPRT